MCFAGIQGTCQTYKKLEDPNIMYSCKYHDVWEFKAPWKAKEKQHAGIAFMAPKGMNRHLKKICLPKSAEMQGRAVILYFAGLGYELIFVVVYLNPQGNCTRTHGANEKIWYWVHPCISTPVPLMATPPNTPAPSTISFH
jgi:exonuclease III